MDSSFEEGKLEGKLEGKIEVAITLKTQNIAIDIIALSTGLTRQEIEDL